jgi:dTDP-4-amino-4,6-dideoxygalactose transaminase
VHIPFNKPYMVGRELDYIAEAHANRHLSGDGAFTRRCNHWLEERTGAKRALLTHSCTAALEMAAILANIGPGDEVIMPSFTFVSTANAFVLRGGVPVFVDVRPDTLNIDESLIEAAITPRTRAICVVHYAGVGCEMDAIMDIASRHGLIVIEDAAQGLMAGYRGQPLGSIAHLGAVSFHETKNVISGEGGALLINRPEFIERAEIIREKGTNRSRFLRGEVDKYTWEDIGSSYLPSELVAAFLWAQMEHADDITGRRLALWERYHQGLAHLEREGRVRLPRVPAHCAHNAHMYFVLLEDRARREQFLAKLREADISAVSHYVALHDSTMGRTRARVHGGMTHTLAACDGLARLPFWLGLEEHVDQVLRAVTGALNTK